MPKASGAQSSDVDHELLRQEVEGEPGEAGDQQQRVAADEAVLDGADDAAGAAHRLLGAGDEAVDDEALEDAVGEAADRQRRADDEDVDQLVEVPLVDEEGVQRPEAADQRRRRLRAQDVEPVGDADAGDARSRRRSPGRARRRRPRARSRASGESAKTGSRKLVTTSSTPGTWIRPANRARKASTPIATFIGGDCSAMWCSAPGKPTSVSSSSPVAGLRGVSWREVAGVDQLLRLLAGLAGEDAEDQPEGVDRGQQRAEVAEDCEDRRTSRRGPSA